jgi:hypothetical protein
MIRPTNYNSGTAEKIPEEQLLAQEAVRKESYKRCVQQALVLQAKHALKNGEILNDKQRQAYESSHNKMETQHDL